jgi:hypothetical protein
MEGRKKSKKLETWVGLDIVGITAEFSWFVANPSKTVRCWLKRLYRLGATVSMYSYISHESYGRDEIMASEAGDTTR